MSTDFTPVKPGEIRFHQASPPPIPPGDYAVKVSQSVAGAQADSYTSIRQGINERYEAVGDFSVSGPRFHLKPSEVYSVYPPAGQFGPFDDALPHIVFTRRTLPWERSIDGKPQDPDAPTPWLALLLFGRDDFEDGNLPKVTARTVAELMSPGGSIQGPKGLALEGGQVGSDLCNTIDIPRGLFARIVPTIKDLPFLAHVREVNTGAKETLSLKQDGWFTVVLGNRLPASAKGGLGETNLICLVSLEGFAGLLPSEDNAGNATVVLDAGKSEVRLAVLASWQFTCHGKNDFKTRMAALDDTSLLVLVSWSFVPDDFVDVPSLATKLKERGRPIDAWLADKLSVAGVPALAKYPMTEPEAAILQSLLLKGFNGLLGTHSIYDAERFAGVALRPETLALLKDATRASQARLDRLLLEDAYPLELARSRFAGDDPGTNAVWNALELGYTALNHNTRLGEKTVSWYRGPLVPLELPSGSPYAFIPCADRALRYDFRSGLFAAEYASAYELGRLMGLQDKNFASAMYRYRKRVAQGIAAEKRQDNLEEALGVPDDLRGKSGEEDTKTTYKPFISRGTLEDALANLFCPIANGNQDAAVPPEGPSTPAVKPAGVLTGDVSFVLPPEVTRFLARAVLLYRIPFHYLVPDERMLPPESIRFFYLDPGWISTLIQGATSVGRQYERDLVLDTMLRHRALDAALNGATDVRQKDPACKKPERESAHWPLTGFLLRSELVEGWQGVEVRAMGKKGAELAPLRIDRLGPDILLCIFNGEVTTLTVKQPPEGVHFGLSPADPPGNYKRLSLRTVTEVSGSVQPGEQIPDPDTRGIASPMRLPTDPADAPTRVVRVAALADCFAGRLAALGYPATTFTSAEFGVEMVESPGLVVFTSPQRT